MSEPTIKEYWLEKFESDPRTRLVVVYSDEVVAFCWLELQSSERKVVMETREALMKYVESKIEQGIDSCFLYAAEYRKKRLIEAKGTSQRVN